MIQTGDEFKKNIKCLRKTVGFHKLTRYYKQIFVSRRRRQNILYTVWTGFNSDFLCFIGLFIFKEILAQERCQDGHRVDRHYTKDLYFYFFFKGYYLFILPFSIFTFRLPVVVEIFSSVHVPFKCLLHIVPPK